MRALECTEPTTDTSPHRTFKHVYTGENVGITSNGEDIRGLLWNWFSEGEEYNYLKGICGYFSKPSDACNHYLEVMR